MGSSEGLKEEAKDATEDCHRVLLEGETTETRISRHDRCKAWIWRRRVVLSCLVVALAVCGVLAGTLYPRPPVVDFASRSSLHIDLPFRPLEDGVVHIHFHLNLSADNHNNYDMLFSNTQITAIAFNGVRLGNATLSQTIRLRRHRTSYIDFGVHGTVTLQEGVTLLEDCAKNSDLTRVRAEGSVDVHVGPLIRLQHPIDPIFFDFPCILTPTTTGASSSNWVT